MLLAYLLTWTTYGTWLHGDARGSVDREHNQFGHPRAEPRLPREAARREQLKGEPVSLDAAARQVVQDTIRRHCGIRMWRLLECNVRTNHAHVIVAAAAEPDVVMEQFKAWCTRLLRDGGLVGPDQKVWTEGGSTRYLWDERSLEAARRYVREGQGPKI